MSKSKESFTVIGIPWSQRDIEQLSLVVDDKGEFEAEEPIYRCFATHC